MKLVIFGLTVSSSWGNGHATLWRGLIRELTQRGHSVVFFEKDVPYYATHRDFTQIEGGELILYTDLASARPRAQRHLRDADVGIVTSYCPDAVTAAGMVLDSAAISVFYDMDTPVTLQQLRAGKTVPYLPPQGLGDFDLVLSFTGGVAVSELHNRLNAKRVAPLYGSVDPRVHRPVPPCPDFQSHLSYLGTYSSDRQTAVRELFLNVAEASPDKRFLVGGSLYPDDFPWLKNTFHQSHVPPAQHPAFYCSSKLTLNVTRGPMAGMGYCPSGRLFEAAACGAPMVSDLWQGIDEFFSPEEEIILARKTEDVVNALSLSDSELRRISDAALDRVLRSHTARQRALDLEQLLSSHVETRLEEFCTKS